MDPAAGDRILPSVTRQWLIDVAGAVAEVCTLDTLHGAEEAFLASSVREVQPLAAIDELQLKAAPGRSRCVRTRRCGRRSKRSSGDQPRERGLPPSW